MPKVVSEGLLLVLTAESKLLLTIFTNTYPEKNIFQIHCCLPHTSTYIKLFKQIRIILHFDSAGIFTVNPNKAL